MLAVSWASESGCAVSRRAQSDGGGSQKCESYSRIGLLGDRKPMEAGSEMLPGERRLDALGLLGWAWNLLR
jgi:hypothetical protein